MSAVKHLGIAWALVRFYFRIIPRDWYRHSPFVPVPPGNYVAWRFHTAYGKRRPGWRELLHDLWQFGDWLRQFNRY